MSPIYPDDSIQGFIGTWWEEVPPSQPPERGRLLWAMVPHVDQQPMLIAPEGRSEATQHQRALFSVEPYDVRHPPKAPGLPVAGMPAFKGEVRGVYRAKVRPVIVVATKPEDVPATHRTGDWKTAPTLLVVPSYGVEESEKRKGWPEGFVRRIRRCEYPQYLWDRLPLKGSSAVESIVRLDHLQPIGAHYKAYDPRPYRLSADALLVLDEWIDWIFHGDPPAGGILDDFRTTWVPAAP